MLKPQSFQELYPRKLKLHCGVTPVRFEPCSNECGTVDLLDENKSGTLTSFQVTETSRFTISIWTPNMPFVVLRPNTIKVRKRKKRKRWITSSQLFFISFETIACG
jgi:hypothetical protein